ncbi:hypothetical protein [Candidatus Liberibacter sp.]|uniref:hypothetical protein n=1 Tax=Candidatus Liberibacter sp. TaxID=34022 RepID=UPI0015F4AB2A|nr:hypothetical protein [Candidatus Liberibacter sp.]MBA5724594.1 hypothetical protein [Candidatus Liberibacter sp.]
MIEPTAGSVLGFWAFFVFLYCVIYGMSRLVASGLDDWGKNTTYTRKACILLNFLGFSVFNTWLFLSLHAFGVVPDWASIPLVVLNCLGGLLWWNFNKEKERR